MSGIFDNFFGKISTTLNGGKSRPSYTGLSQVNTGTFYSYHENGTNNRSWMLKQEIEDSFKSLEEQNKMNKPRMGSVSSVDDKSRHLSVSE